MELGLIGRGVGAGFVIDGQRIMTNAHVVSNSRYLTVEREGDPNKYPATVLFVAHDCDLALLKVAAPNFFKNMMPLDFGGIPALESTVSAYGYPIGGERMSVTTGIVSRIDFQPLHAFVDRFAPRDSDQRADQSGQQRRPRHAGRQSGWRRLPRLQRRHRARRRLHDPDAGDSPLSQRISRTAITIAMSISGSPTRNCKTRRSVTSSA